MFLLLESDKQFSIEFLLESYGLGVFVAVLFTAGGVGLFLAAIAGGVFGPMEACMYMYIYIYIQ